MGALERILGFDRRRIKKYARQANKVIAYEETMKNLSDEELKAKTDRLNELNALLNVDKRENEIVGGEPDEGEEPPEKKPRDLER